MSTDDNDKRTLSIPPLRPPPAHQSSTSSGSSRPPLPILLIPQSQQSTSQGQSHSQNDDSAVEIVEFSNSPVQLSPSVELSSSNSANGHSNKLLSPSHIPSLTLTESTSPPSPTLSTLSSDSKSTIFHPVTSLALRDNNIEQKHGRKLSINTLSSVGETEEEGDLEAGIESKRTTDGKKVEAEGGRRSDTMSPDSGMSTAPTTTSRLSRFPLIGKLFGHSNHKKDEDGIPMPATSSISSSYNAGDKKRKGKKGDAEKDGEEGKKKKEKEGPPDKAELIADPTDEGMLPFSTLVKPSHLNALVDPKSFENLENLGGTKGLLNKLGVVDGKGLEVPFEATLTRSMTRTSIGTGPVHKTTPQQVAVKKDEAATSGSGAAGGAPSGEGEGEGFVRANYNDRTRVFGENRIPAKKTKSLLELMWMALTDKVLIVLSVAAVVSLALGLYQDLGTEPERYHGPGCPEIGCKQPQVDWVEGLAIMVAIFIVVVVGSVNDYQKERQFQRLNSIKEARFVKVIRQGGQEQQISVYDVVVGDILLLEPGEIIPVDGVFLSGHNVKCDESGATGEPDMIKKCTYEEAMLKQEKGHLGAHEDCFLLSGSKVAEGYGRYVAIAVGTRSFNGRIMMSLQRPAETTPLQTKLNHLAETIAKLGSAAGLLLFGVLMIRFFVQLGTHSDRSADEKAQNFIQILIIAVTVVVVAVPEGLPLAVTLSLAFATRRMTKMNLLVRVLGSCETMGHCTVTCTDKTGTLTQNKMMVVAGSVGVHLKFASDLEETKRTNANDDVDIDPELPPSRGSSNFDEAVTPVTPRVGRKDFSVDLKDLGSRLSPALKTLLNESIAVNSTAFEGEDERSGEMTFIGSKTEVALLTMARNLEWENYKDVRGRAEILQMIPFSSERKCMGVVVKLPDGKARLYLKGASEVLAKLCLRHVHVDELPDVSTTNISDIRLIAINDETRGNINRTIIYYANQSLRTIALCYRDIPQWPIGSAKQREANGGEVPFGELVRDLTLVGITAIEDPLRPGVTEAVATCQKAGVAVKMCTGDNILTARSIATQCGIYSAGGIIMEGPVFRKLSPQDMNEVVPRLQVLARSSPEDKERLVNHLKGMGEIVGVTGDGTNDGPALKTANVGFSMGIAGTEVAKEASDIILMDDNFANIVSAIMWGRCVNDSVRKFIQFQISVNIVAVLITFISAVASSDEQSVLTAVQLLWVNLIMDTFAALALATDPANPVVLNRKPDKASDPLISVDMWKMISGQAIFQTITALVLHFAGKKIFDYTATEHEGDVEQDKVSTLVFNAFVFQQIFNQLNCRRLDRQFNIFEGFWRNYYFLAIFLIMVGGQVLIVLKGGAAFQVVSISGRDWAISIVLGLLSLPLGVLIRLLPTEPIHQLLIRMRLFPDPNYLPTISPLKEGEEWNEGITKVIDNLSTFSQIRGARMRSSSIVRKSRNAMLKEHDIHPGALMAMVPSLVLSSVGAGWKPSANGATLADPASADPSKSSAQLFKTGIQVHPDTDENDPLVRKYGLVVPPSPASATHSRHSSVSSIKHGKSDALASPAGSSPQGLTPASARTQHFPDNHLSPNSGRRR